MFASNYEIREYVVKINNIRRTIEALEHSLVISRNLESEEWLRYALIKTRNRTVLTDLKKANKRNKDMLNLFRHSVTDANLGNGSILPESLQREVQRTWHKKYDALLAQNEQLKKEVFLAECIIKEKIKEIDDLQQKLLSLADLIIERDKKMKQISQEYSKLKQQKQQEELIFEQYSKRFEVRRQFTFCEKDARWQQQSRRNNRNQLLYNNSRVSSKLNQ